MEDFDQKYTKERYEKEVPYMRYVNKKMNLGEKIPDFEEWREGMITYDRAESSGILEKALLLKGINPKKYFRTINQLRSDYIRKNEYN